MGSIRRRTSLDLPVCCDLKHLAGRVAANGGVLTVSAGNLRNRYGADRLFINVRNKIAKELAGLGVAHYPRTIPDRQEELVRLYTQGTPVAKLIEAVLSVGKDSDALILKAVNNESERIVSKMRELLD